MFYKKYKFAFQHINRTGGLSIKKVITDEVGSPDSGSTTIDGAHRSLVDCFESFRRHHPGDNIGDLSIYANVRGPLARLVSIYSFRKSRRNAYAGKDFRWFFYNVYMSKGDITDGGQKPYITGESGYIPGNITVVKFGDISSVWPGILSRHFGIEIHRLPVVNKSEHGNPVEYFDREMISIVIEKEQWLVEKFYPELLELV